MYSVIDTNAFYKNLEPTAHRCMSLKFFTKQYLNLNLIKSEQLSNWAKRPLNSNQLTYAACDALVLIRLYDAMRCEVEDFLPFDTLLPDILHDYVFDATSFQLLQKKSTADCLSSPHSSEHIENSSNQYDHELNNIKKRSLSVIDPHQFIVSECIQDKILKRITTNLNVIIDDESNSDEVSSRSSGSLMSSSKRQKMRFWTPLHRHFL
jgi:hypothetical protein